MMFLVATLVPSMARAHAMYIKLELKRRAHAKPLVLISTFTFVCLHWLELKRSILIRCGWIQLPIHHEVYNLHGTNRSYRSGNSKELTAPHRHHQQEEAGTWSLFLSHSKTMTNWLRTLCFQAKWQWKFFRHMNDPLASVWFHRLTAFTFFLNLSYGQFKMVSNWEPNFGRWKNTVPEEEK